MNRFRIGISLLAILLALGLFIQTATQRNSIPVASALHNAADSALSGRWKAAEHYSSLATDRWKSRWHATAALADHQPMEDIDGLLAQLPVYAAAEDAEEFAAACSDLARRVEAMADAHALHWWNLL